MITQTRTEGPTPAGGAYAIAYWRDAAGAPTLKEAAVQAEIIEYGADDEPIARTYARLDGRSSTPQRTGRA